MKRKKIISGSDAGITLTVTISLDTGHRLFRQESQRLMDRTADAVMQIFPALPLCNIPLSRLKMK